MSPDNSILVVDDDPDIRTLVAEVLKSEGYRVEETADGYGALEAVGRRMPALILLDMKMPGMDGWQFAKEFHARHDGRSTIVVFTATDDARKRAEEIGARGWIGKPFTLDELLSVVRRHLRQ